MEMLGMFGRNDSKSIGGKQDSNTAAYTENGHPKKGACKLLTIFFPAVLALVGLSLALGSRYFRHSGPRLEFAQYSKDLGDVPVNASPNVAFKFYNKGDRDLVIYGLQGSCACQNLRVTKSRILPGETGQVLAQVIPGRRDGPATDIIRVRCNDPKQPVQTVHIKRFVVANVTILPQRLTITVSDDKPQIREVTVLGPTKKPDFKILKVKSDDRRITPQVTPLGVTQEGRSKWRVCVTVEPGSIHSVPDCTKISIFTSDQKQFLVTLPIIIYYSDRIELIPSSLSFIIREGSPWETSRIHVVCSDTGAAVNARPDVKPPGYAKVTLLSENITMNSKEWVFEVRLNAGTEPPAQPQSDKIEFCFPEMGFSKFVPVSVIKIKNSGTQ